MYIALVALLLLQGSLSVLENDFLQVYKNSAPCATASPSCAERIVVALGSIELGGQKMSRGDVKVFRTGERYLPPQGGEYIEVTMKPVRPQVQTPSVAIRSDKARVVYEGERFFIIDETVHPGETTIRHSHNPRLLIPLNAARNEQWVDGRPETFQDLIPDNIQFLGEPVVHTAKSVGRNSIRNIMIELKP